MLTLIAKEWKEILREQRGAYALLLFCCMALFACLSLATTNKVEQRASERAAADEYSRWLGQGNRYAHAAAHFGMHVFAPVYSTADFDPGVSPYVGHSVWLEAHVQDPALYRPAQDRAAAGRIGALTPALLLNTVLPLLVIVLGCGIVAGERARGTWRITLVHARSAIALVMSKGIALFTVAATLCAATMGFSRLLAAYAHLPATPHEGARWSALLGTYLLHAFVWTSLTLAVSTMCRRTGTAFASLLSLWLAVCIVVPRLAHDLASERHTVLSQSSLAATMRAELGDVEGGNREAQTTDRLIRQYGVSRAAELPLRAEGVYREEAEEAGDVVFDRLWGTLHERYLTQERLVAKLGWLSPTLATQSLSELLAATDDGSHVQFLDGAEQHRRLIQQTMNIELSKKRNAVPSEHPISGPEVWAKVPMFRFAGPQTLGGSHGSVLLQALVGELLTSALLATLLLGAATLRSRRSAA